MHAVQQRGLGGPEVLELVELPRPEPREGQVLIEVSRVGVNFTDVLGRRTGMRSMVDADGAPQRLSSEDFPVIPGGEVVGLRADTGERVVALCGSGGYAEWAVAAARNTYSVPADISDEDALALFVQGTSAWHLYQTAARLSGEETVVIQAAAGGAGSIAVQLGRSMGAARIIAMASSEEKRQLAISLGADRAVDSSPDGLTERLLEANDGFPVDVVFDMAGGEVFERCFAALATFGRIVLYATASGVSPTIGGRALITGSRSVTGFWLMDVIRTTGLAPALDDLFERTQRGELRPVIGQMYALSDAAQAQEDLQQRRTMGKLCLDPRR